MTHHPENQDSRVGLIGVGVDKTDSSSTGGTPLPGIPPAPAKAGKLCNSDDTDAGKNLFAKSFWTCL